MRRVLLASLVWSIGCTEITNAGEYRVGDRGPADGPVENPCGRDEVLTDDGRCEHVGVPVEVCEQSGFEPAPDGACTAIMPAEDCIEGLAYPGSPSCDTTLGVPTCNEGRYPSLGGIDRDLVIYVDAAVTSDCTPRGSEACPFSTIGAALDQITEGTGRFVSWPKVRTGRT